MSGVGTDSQEHSQCTAGSRRGSDACGVSPSARPWSESEPQDAGCSGDRLVWRGTRARSGGGRMPALQDACGTSAGLAHPAPLVRIACGRMPLFQRPVISREPDACRSNRHVGAIFLLARSLARESVRCCLDAHPFFRPAETPRLLFFFFSSSSSLSGLFRPLTDGRTDGRADGRTVETRHKTCIQVRPSSISALDALRRDGSRTSTLPAQPALVPIAIVPLCECVACRLCISIGGAVLITCVAHLSTCARAVSSNRQLPYACLRAKSECEWLRLRDWRARPPT